MDGWNYGWMMCLNLKHPFSDIQCGKANWEKLVVEPHEMSMEVDQWILWNWWNIVYGRGDGIDGKMFIQMGMDEMFWN